MKIFGIGDLFIPAVYIENGFSPLREQGHIVEARDWPLQSFDQLQAINLKIEQFGVDAVDTPEEMVPFCQDAQVIVTQFCPITRKLVDACPSLRAIGVLRAGTENVCVEYARQKGIQVFNAPGRNADSVADFTMGLMLCEARNIARGHSGLMSGQWIRDYSNNGIIPDFAGRTVGLIGCGEIGRKVAKRLSGFEVRILGYDPFVDALSCEQAGIERVDLDTLLTESDFVSLHARLTETNRGLIGKKQLSLMKRTAYLINTSRAGLIDEPALVEALEKRLIAGAALDVFEEEPPRVGHPLLRLGNITVTPHMAGGSNDAFYRTPALLRARMQGWFQTTQHESLVP